MRRARGCGTALLWLLGVSVVCAQTPPAPERDDLDVTMRVIVDPNSKVPDEIVRRIPLPKPAQSNAPAKPADQPAEPGKPAEPGAKGQDRAAQAREQGREFGQQVSDQAKQRAEEARRNKPPATPPGQPPGPPGTPPGRPPNPPGRPPG
jgi:hypothetical protein